MRDLLPFIALGVGCGIVGQIGKVPLWQQLAVSVTVSGALALLLQVVP